MRSLYQRIKTYVPLGARLIFALSIFSAAIYLLCMLFPKFADFINYETAPVRISLTALSNVFPLSIFEMLLILSPLAVILLIFKAVKATSQGRISSIRMATSIVACVLIYFILFVFTLASGYHTTRIEEKLSLNTEGIEASDIYDVSLTLSKELNTLSNLIAYNENGASASPYTYKELSEKICKAYFELEEKTGLLVSFNSRIKPIMFSKALTYTHISGIYLPLTGEACVNTSYPDFIIASSSAHEMAHQRGIAREDEASFVGFLALTHSNEPYLRYSAYLNLYMSLLSDLKREDKELYNKARYQLNEKVQAELISYSKHYEKYRNSTISKVSNTINNAYLQANGDKNGTKSYDRLSKLACAYILHS
ncbi:MAG: DUF3810 domain-containing protein [Clostridia bacterium]|nr:DUF3810 domain-containing protein [Clostridia bacterium]